MEDRESFCLFEVLLFFLCLKKKKQVISNPNFNLTKLGDFIDMAESVDGQLLSEFRKMIDFCMADAGYNPSNVVLELTAMKS